MTIPVLIFTGYLGSGKTTLLASLLADKTFAKSALLVNEVGEIGIDQLLLDDNDTAPVVLMDGGCVCCSIQGDLGMSLRNLMLRAERGDIPQFERVIIETTGIAYPAPILQALISDEWTRRQFYIHSVVTCVDAIFGQKTLATSSEAREQAVFADRLIVTKTDIATEKQLLATEAALAEINSHAPVSPVVSGECDPTQFLRSVPVQERLYVSGSTNDAPGHHRHDLPVSTAAVELDHIMRWSQLAGVLDYVARRHRDTLLRVKGLCWTLETEQPILIQGVRDTFFPPRILNQWPSQDRRTSLVFIATGSAAGAVRDDFMNAINDSELVEVVSR